MSGESEGASDNLEKRVAKIEQNMKKMMPSRRQMLAAGGVGLLGFASGNASAAGLNDGDTQWGTNSNRDDYVVDTLDANLVDTEQIVSGEITNVDGSTLADIDAAIDADGYALLVPGKTYSGSTTVTLDQPSHQVFMFGAFVDYTGTSYPFHIDNASSGQSAKDSPGIYGGVINLPGAAEAGIRITDTYAAYLDRTRIEGTSPSEGPDSSQTTAGVLWKDDNEFSEECEAYSLRIRDCQYAHLFQDSGAGGSNKGTKIIGGHMEPGPNGAGFRLESGHGVYDSMFGQIGMNVNAYTSMIDIQNGGMGDSIIRDLKGESQGSPGAHVISFGENAGGNMPALINCSMNGNAGYVGNNPNNIGFSRIDYGGNGSKTYTDTRVQVYGDQLAVDSTPNTNAPFIFETFDVTLDATDSTTPVEAARPARTMSLVFVGRDRVSCSVWTAAFAGDFDGSEAISKLASNLDRYNVTAKNDSTIYVSSAATGHEGEHVAVGILSFGVGGVDN
jgi:hypothetical protein